MADHKSRALQRKPAAGNLKLGTSKLEDTDMVDAPKEQQTPRKYKRPNTRDAPTPSIPRSFDTPPVDHTPRTAWIRRGSTLDQNPNADPWYGDPGHRPPPGDEPIWYHQGEDLPGFPRYDPNTGGHGRYDFGGRQYKGPEVRALFPSYPSKDFSERRLAAPTRKRQLSSEDHEGEQKRKDIHLVKDEERETKATSHHTRTIPDSLLDASTRGTRELSRALPCVAKEGPQTSKEEVGRSSVRQMTLALRPASSVEYLKGKKGSPTPAPVVKRQRTVTSLKGVEGTDPPYDAFRNG